MLDKLAVLSSYIRARHGFRFATRQTLERFQQARLSDLTRRVLPQAPYYKDYLGLPFSAYPVMNKQRMTENFDQLNTVGITRDAAMKVAVRAEESRDFSPEIDGISVGLSTGTSGMRGVFLLSKAERYSWAGTILGKMLPSSILRTHRIAFFLRANNNLYDSLSSGGRVSFRFFDLIKPLDELIEQLNTYRPSVLIAPAQVLRELALAQLNGDLTVSPQRVISVAEVLFDDDRAIIEQAFEPPVHQVYQCTEGFLGYTCALGHLHLNEGFVHIEPDWIDGSKTRFSPIITDFTRQTQPFIRFRLDDVLTMSLDPCACGGVERVISRIEGREDDILILQRRSDGAPYKLMPDYVTRALAATEGTITDFAVEQNQSDVLKILLKAKDIGAAEQCAADEISKLMDRHELKMPKLEFGLLAQGNAMHKRRRVLRSWKEKA